MRGEPRGMLVALARPNRVALWHSGHICKSVRRVPAPARRVFYLALWTLGDGSAERRVLSAGEGSYRWMAGAKV